MCASKIATNLSNPTDPFLIDFVLLRLLGTYEFQPKQRKHSKNFSWLKKCVSG